MRNRIALLVALVAVAAGSVSALPKVTPVEPFKVGNFLVDGEETLALVVRDRYVVELHDANQDLERGRMYVQIPMARDMKELAGRYHLDLQRRLYQILNHVVTGNRLEGADRPWYVHDLSDVRTLAPIPNPRNILNAAGNYYGHVGEANTPEEQARIAEERRRDRGIPYLFLKATSAIIGNGEPIVVPKGRSKIDWECELGVVIGQPARFVTKEQAKEHIFGFTIEVDVSDRGGRGEAESRSDWLVGKGQDTFAPLGPFVVPAEFIENPMNLHQTLKVNGEVMQDAYSSDMIHDIYELIEYGSERLTLEPGDVIGAGSPRGAGMSRSARPEQIFMKPGDVMEASIEGIGTLTHRVRAYDETARAAPTSSR